jgi:hypothetical protein
MADPGPARADAVVEQRLAELDELLARVEQIPGPAGELAMEAVAALAEIYGAALARAVAQPGAPVAAFTADPLLGALLALHGIHPDSVDVRVGRALGEAGEVLGAHGGQVRLRGIAHGVAELAVTPGHGCGSPAPAEVEEAVRGAVLAAAPELADVRVVTLDGARSPAFVPLDSLLHAPVGAPR